MQVTPVLERVISLIAEAKLHLLLAAAARSGTHERKTEVQALRQSTFEARKYVDEQIGFESLPTPLAVELLVCEKTIAKLTE